MNESTSDMIGKAKLPAMVGHSLGGGLGPILRGILRKPSLKEVRASHRHAYRIDNSSSSAEILSKDVAFSTNAYSLPCTSNTFGLTLQKDDHIDMISACADDTCLCGTL